MEHLEQTRQKAFTLINGLQGLCTAAGAVTVADEPEDQMMDFDGSDEEFRQIESIAGRRNCQIGKKTLDIQTFANRKREFNSHKFRSRASNPSRRSLLQVRMLPYSVYRCAGVIGAHILFDAYRQFLGGGGLPDSVQSKIYHSGRLGPDCAISSCSEALTFCDCDRKILTTAICFGLRQYFISCTRPCSALRHNKANDG